MRSEGHWALGWRAYSWASIGLAESYSLGGYFGRDVLLAPRRIRTLSKVYAGRRDPMSKTVCSLCHRTEDLPLKTLHRLPSDLMLELGTVRVCKELAMTPSQCVLRHRKIVSRCVVSASLAESMVEIVPGSACIIVRSCARRCCVKLCC